MGAVLVVAAFALPGIASAHGGWNYMAGAAGTAPTIDGIVNASEWADATEYPVVFGAPVNANGTVRFVHNGGDLYVAAVVQDPSPSLTPLFDVRFDNDHDGTYDSGDDAWLSSPADFFYDPAVSSFVNDLTAPGGTQDTVAARTIGGGAVTFELRHPLCSVDAAHDVCASFGQTLGVNFQYARTAGGIDWANAPGGFDPTAWANLILAAGDVVAPSVTVTQPPAGSVLSGTVAVSATATDNVGVTEVVFRYFGGALPYVELGTDTTAPYTAMFDSTQVPNTAPLGGTVYAFARDAAGNETGVGNGVTVSNVPGGRIFFETSRDGNSEIYSMTPAGTGLTRLTTSAGVPDSRPSVSPNGSLVAWQAGPEIWLMNSDGTSQQALATSGTNGAPAFSPDGTKIAFESNRGGAYDIWVMNANGTNPVNLTSTPVADGSPTWSPDGTKLAFHSGSANSEDIFTMNADGTLQTPLPGNSLARDVDPDWSPNGQKILFVSSRAATSVWSVNLDGTGLLNVTGSGNFDADPAWSPDGSHIAFTRDNQGSFTFQIWIAQADGTSQTRLTFEALGQRNSFPDWGADAATFPDLKVDSIALGAPPPLPQPNSYTVTVRNAGTVAANLSGVVVQGYYSADTAIGPTDAGACGNTMSGTLAAGATAEIAVGCSAAPGAGHNYLLVRVDDSNALVESDETNNVGVAALVRLTAASISITGDSSAPAGAASAAIRSISIDAIRGATSGPSATPLGGIPLGGIPLGGIPLGGIPLGGIPLGGIPLGGIGFTSTNLDQNGLGGVPLSTIPLESTTDTWQKRLDANAAFKGTPVQSVTLAQVLGTSVVTSPTPVSLDDLDLAASPLGGIPLGGIALGGIPLGGIPLGGIPLGGISPADWPSDNLGRWCAFINVQPGFDCTVPSTLANQTMIGISLQGVPLGGIPLGGIPLGGIDLSQSPLGGIPLGGIPLGGIDLDGTPLGGIPLGGIPLGGIDLASSPLGGIPLGGIDLANSPLGGIPLGGIPLGGIPLNEVIDCTTFNCSSATATLADAFAAGAIRSDATLAKAFAAKLIAPTAKVEDIGYYCKPGMPGNTACRQGETPILLKDFVLNGLPPGVTLEDLLGTILSNVAYDWESLPLPGFPIQDFSNDGGTVSYTATFTLTGTGSGVFPATVGVTLPEVARYVPGSTVPPAGVTASQPTLLAADNELVWNLTGVPLNTPQTLTFEVKPGLKLGTASATAKIAAGSLPAVQAPAPAATTIRQNWEVIEGPSPQIASDTLYFGHTPNGDDRDLFRLPVPAAGTQVTVHLSHLKLDNDLVVYGAVPPPLRTPRPSTSVLQTTDVPPDLQQRTQAITPEVLADVPVNPPAGQSVLGISDNRGLADEEVTFIVPEDSAGFVNIQISSFDGAYSNEPWMLRVEENAPVELPTFCRKPPPGITGAPRTLPTSIVGSTLYLVNSTRYRGLYGPDAEERLWTKLQAMKTRTDAAGGTVIPVDAISTVAPALTAWYGDPCSPGRTNDVVRALGAYLDTVTAPYKYIVLVGDWTVLPPGLVLDNTAFANERSYASTFYGAENTQYLSSYALGYLPTDDPYGDTSYSGRGTYVPEVAVGRLVETPVEIEAQLQQYLDRQGAIDPSTALVTGYDFLKDGAQQISAGLKANVTAPKELINDVWSKSDLLSALFPATNPPQIASINAHFDHNRALPADDSAAGTEANLFTTAHVQPTPGRLVITIGCHSGTPVSDLVFTGTPALTALAPDWNQTFAAQGAIGYIANSGFGLGETAGVAYSEKLHALLAQRLDGSLTVGQALVFAKNEYMAVPLSGGYDLKVVNGAGLYGLPMYRVGTGTVPPAPAPLALTTDAATGLAAASFSLSQTHSPVTASTGRYFTVSGDASFQNRRPIEPFVKLDVTQPGRVAHGALLTAATSSDTPNFDAAFSRAIEDSAAFSPELVGDATSPTRLQSIATFSTPLGPQQRLVMSTGQFLSDGVPDALGVGTQRLFNLLAGVVLYAPVSATDFTVPAFGPVQALATGVNTIGFSVDVTDGVGVVERVVALYKDSTGAWRSTDLARVGTSSRWSGGGAFAGSDAEWFLQAADESGNVGVISNKAHIDPVDPPEPVGTITGAPSGTLVNGWYTGDVTVTISGAPDVVSSLDGAPFAPTPVVTVSGTGLHTVQYQGSNGASGTTIVPIDVTPPTVSVTPGVLAVGQTANYGFYSCADAGSGVATCAVSEAIDTSTPTNGVARTVDVTATDRVGLASSPTRATYQVVYRGFLQPVDNLPVLNSVKAGSGVPVKFRLGGNQGTNIFALGYPKSRTIGCVPTDAVAPLEETTTLPAGGSTLSYNAVTDQYTYTWKTEKAWAVSCRQLVVKFTNGLGEHAANFTFTK